MWLTLGIALSFVFQFLLTVRCPPRYANKLVVGVIVAASVMGLVLSFIDTRHGVVDIIALAGSIGGLVAMIFYSQHVLCSQ